MVGCNVLTSIDALAYSHHCRMWYRFGKNLPKWQFIFHNPYRVSKFPLVTSCINSSATNIICFQIIFSNGNSIDDLTV